MWSVCYSSPTLSKVSFGRQGLLKIPNIKFYQTFVHREPSCSTQTDRQLDAIKCTVALWDYFTKAPKCQPLPLKKLPLVSDGFCRPAPCWSRIAAELWWTYVKAARGNLEKKLQLKSEWPCTVSDKTGTHGRRRSIFSDGVICWHKQFFIFIMTFFPFLLLKLKLIWSHIRSANCSGIWFSEFVLMTQCAKVI